MKWQCSYTDVNGIRCENEALQRIHFSSEHPFNHVDVCSEHFEEYKRCCWIQDLHDKNGEEIFQ